MVKSCRWALIGAILPLAACGGGGVNSSGSVATTPPSQPTSNATVGNLVASQSFTNDASNNHVTFDLTTKTAVTGTAAKDTLAVSYDASSKSYTLTAGGSTQTFAPANISATSSNDTQYRINGTAGNSYLTLVKQPYTSAIAPQYVALGYWQRDTIVNSQQTTDFDTFTYGLPSMPAAVPRTGSVSFGVDTFGLASTPGFEPRVFEGHGELTVDFLSGVFSTSIPVTETGLLTGAGIVGGGVEVDAAGHLASGDGTFSGNVLYGGQNGQIAGSLNGRFYGPNAEELGAAFSGGTAAGAALDGGFTGQRDTGSLSNETLTNLVASQLFYTQGAVLSYTSFDGNAAPSQARDQTTIGQLQYQNSSTFSFGPGNSNLPGGTYTANNVIASSDPNFTSYDASFGGQDVRLDLYKPGSANGELALTYLSFGRWSSTSRAGVETEADRVFFTYGLSTPAQLLAAKTGAAHYAGVAYGAAANQRTGAQYDLTGSASFDVNFSTQNYTGDLALKGTSTNGAAATDFGSFSFGGRLSASTADSQAALMQNGAAMGSITHRFYGPDGEEIGGPFQFEQRDANGLLVVAATGVAVTKRQ
jgi:hypothetical protein